MVLDVQVTVQEHVNQHASHVLDVLHVVDVVDVHHVVEVVQQPVQATVQQPAQAAVSINVQVVTVLVPDVPVAPAVEQLVMVHVQDVVIHV